MILSPLTPQINGEFRFKYADRTIKNRAGRQRKALNKKLRAQKKKKLDLWAEEKQLIEKKFYLEREREAVRVAITKARQQSNVELTLKSELVGLTQQILKISARLALIPELVLNTTREMGALSVDLYTHSKVRKDAEAKGVNAKLKRQKRLLVKIS